MELELPPERVQEMMIRDWDVVFCQGWLFRNHRHRFRWHEFLEGRGWLDLHPLPGPWEGLVERSWQRVSILLANWARPAGAWKRSSSAFTGRMSFALNYSK